MNVELDILALGTDVRPYIKIQFFARPLHSVNTAPSRMNFRGVALSRRRYISFVCDDSIVVIRHRDIVARHLQLPATDSSG